LLQLKVYFIDSIIQMRNETHLKLTFKIIGPSTLLVFCSKQTDLN